MKLTPRQQLLQKLKAAFPDAVTETRARETDQIELAVRDDFVARLQGEHMDIADQTNRYELQFPGKRQAKAQAAAPVYKTLVADREQSENFDTTRNVFIQGDNLDALRMLQNAYRGKIKMIYIDPPYNTGNDEFVYADDFSVRQQEYLQAAGVVDADGVKQIDEIKNGLKGRFHAGWLAMMLPRLILARELLTDDGVIFISIDDNEQANLKLLCDEVFGEDNLVDNFIWKKRKTQQNLSKWTASAHEYILMYAKSKELCKIGRVELDEDYVKNTYKNPDNDPRGPWRTKPLMIGYPGHKKFELDLRNGRKVVAKWSCNQETYDKYWADNLIWIPRDGEGSPNVKVFLKDNKGRIPTSLIIDVATYEQGSKEIEVLLGSTDQFAYPKPTGLIKYLLKLLCDKNSIVMDFFAGSATTAHAVMQLNAEDEGARKFIMVQWDEKIDAKKSAVAHKFCAEELNRPATIAEISKERIRRAGAQIAAAADAEVDTGFRVFNIRDSVLTARDNKEPIADTPQAALEKYKTELSADNFAPLLYESLLYTGVTLDAPLRVEKAGDYPYAVCANQCYCVSAGLTQDIARAIIEAHPKLEMFYYLSDTVDGEHSATEIDAAVLLADGDCKARQLVFY